jgi:AcrR family transcriptional regulator
MPPPSGPQKRAAPLPPAARRAAIIEAVLPLLVERGEHATSRQLAEAAGVAEGTIFSVFDDKDALFAAALERALDPTRLSAAIGGIDGELPLEAQLEQAVDLIQRRIVDVWQLLSKLHRHRRHAVRPTPLGDSPALTSLFAAAPGRIRIEPAEAAALLRALTLALTHPMFVAEARPPAEIVDQFLHGAARTP